MSDVPLTLGFSSAFAFVVAALNPTFAPHFTFAMLPGSFFGWVAKFSLFQHSGESVN